MFTGIIEKIGRVEALGATSLRVAVDSSWKGISLGSSVAVDGACLTVNKRKISRASRTLSFDLLKETLKKTHFSSLRTGDPVNLERALRADQRIEGHFVQGHVDGVGKIHRVISDKKEKTLVVSFPRALRPYVVPKGSVALNGVSLTVGKSEKGFFWVHLTPYTLRKTNLGQLMTGQKVNLEADALLKFFHGLTSTKGPVKLVDSRTLAGKWHEKI